MRLLLSNYHAQWGWRASTGQSRQNVRVRLFWVPKTEMPQQKKVGRQAYLTSAFQPLWVGRFSKELGIFLVAGADVP
jgi:hypothetical protein